MSDILNELLGNVFIITLNRTDKNNAFDDSILSELHQLLEKAEKNHDVRAIVLKANGKNFSAGADIAWMKRMAKYSEAENIADAKILAKVMYALHSSSKPTIAMVQGVAYGGGAGLIAACDIAIAADTAQFCFSEVKLGLVPAVISPYVVNAIGAKAACWLFISAEVFNAQRAYELQLVHHCVPIEKLHEFSLNYARSIAKLAPVAVKQSKHLINTIKDMPIDDTLIDETAAIIAKKRVSAEGQKGLQAFLNKETPIWD
jgi:methylglutaconyl-CoA hydratase